MDLQLISEKLQAGKARDVKKLVQQAIDEGIPANDILEKGLLSGMDKVGEKFQKEEIFLPEVLMSARAMNMGAALLKPLLQEEGVEAKGKVCLATVRGDIHDIGKNLCKMMMEGKGLEVIDLGVDADPEVIVQTAIDENCRIIACSALLTTTMESMKDVVAARDRLGYKDKIYIMIGGAPVTEAYAKEIGADLYTKDAASCADEAVRLCQQGL